MEGCIIQSRAQGVLVISTVVYSLILIIMHFVFIYIAIVLHDAYAMNFWHINLSLSMYVVIIII